MRIKLFTHTDLDGIGCAVLGKLAFAKENLEIEYCDYNNVNEKVKNFYIGAEKNHYHRVYITDISVSDDVAQIIEHYNDNRCYPPTKLLDHHPTALFLNKYEWANVKVESEVGKECGTKLFYEELCNYFHSRDLIAISDFVENVRRYDTWEWKNRFDDIKPKQMNDLFYILGRNRFIASTLEDILYCDNYTYIENKNKTRDLLLLLNQEKIDGYIKSKAKNLTVKDILGYKAGIVFGEQYHSELGNKLAEMNPHLDFIVIINPEKSISYRSIGDKVDLGKYIASVYGGGGHPNAAGSQINDDIRMKIIDMVFDK